MITNQIIKDALLTELKDKAYNSCSGDMDVLHIIRAVMQNNGLAKESDQLWVRSNKQEITLRYKNHNIGIVNIKKAKGKSHYKWGTNWCDWTYKDFDVCLYNDSLEACIKNVEDAIISENDFANKQRVKALEVMKMIKERSDIKELYEVVDICKYIYDHSYTLRELM